MFSFFIPSSTRGAMKEGFTTTISSAFLYVEITYFLKIQKIGFGRRMDPSSVEGMKWT